MSDPHRRLALRGASLALLALAVSACTRTDERFLATDITGVEWGRDFKLVDHNGQLRTLADFRGQAVMLFFGYTQCPDQCPLTLANIARAVEQLGRDGKRVQVLFITLDPKRDTQDILAQYVPAFHPSFIGLRGTDAEVARTAQDFKVFFALQRPDSSGIYTVDHHAAVFAFDPQGRLRLYMRGDSDSDAMTHDLRLLLRP
jgi:protein SCO1/2